MIGDKIVYSQNGGTRYYTFQKNWNCTDICNDRRTWGFAVDEDCTVILEVNVGDDISTAPQTNCNISLDASIEGTVFFDTNNDCSFDENDILLDDWIVSATGTEGTFYGSTNSEGTYSIPVNNGFYTVSVHIPNALWSACNPVMTTTVENEPSMISFPIQSLTECPQMSVDVSTPFLRRCMDNNYTVQYCNEGTVVANDVYIEVVFPNELTPQSSSIPSTVDGNVYTYNIGSVAIGVCQTFTINALSSCDVDLGEAFCVEAHIYPDSICTTNPDWDGVWIETDAICEEDSIRFFIRNIGTENMTTPLEYYVVEDEVMVRQGAYTLASSEEINFARAATGASFYMQCQQSPFHPLNNLPSVGLEGCGTEPHSTGFLLDFPEDDNASFVSIDCQEIIGSFDPNDKRTEPRGYSSSHFIKNNIELEYHIRFQNTGTDTAFLVVIEDVLSNYLNPATIIPGASSHPYEFRLSDRGTVEFIFENILLPDSTTNEAASHGFVKFRISQAENNANGTVINNLANIYFDYNEPIATNETWHTIGESFITVGVEEVFMENVAVLTAPNPFQEYTIFRIKGQEFSSLAFYLYDATGKQVRYTKEQGNEFKFYREELPSGMYFYTIEADGQRLNTGKIVIH